MRQKWQAMQEAVVSYAGKESNHFEAHRTGPVAEAQRQLECHESAFGDLVAALQQMPTRVIAEATGP